jgi:hypothetical protein
LDIVVKAGAGLGMAFVCVAAINGLIRTVRPQPVDLALRPDLMMDLAGGMTVLTVTLVVATALCALYLLLGLVAAAVIRDLVLWFNPHPATRRAKVLEFLLLTAGWLLCFELAHAWVSPHLAPANPSRLLLGLALPGLVYTWSAMTVDWRPHQHPWRRAA